MSKIEKRQRISVKLEELFYISNLLSVFRIILVPPIVYLIIIERIKIALLIAVIAMLSDLFDGHLARRFNQVSDLGKILDPIGDKLLVSAIFISLLISKSEYMPPAWAIVFIISRDILVFIGNSYLVLRVQTIISANLLSKIATDFIYLTIGSYILDKYFYFLQKPFLILAIIFSAASAVSYIIEMFSVVREKSKESKELKGLATKE